MDLIMLDLMVPLPLPELVVPNHLLLILLKILVHSKTTYIKEISTFQVSAEEILMGVFTLHIELLRDKNI